MAKKLKTAQEAATLAPAAMPIGAGLFLYFYPLDTRTHARLVRAIGWRNARRSGRAKWRSLRAWLESRAESPRAFGDASGPVRFLVNQVGIQFYNRLFRSRPQ